MFLTKEHDNGNVRPLTIENRSLVSMFNSIDTYEDKLRFWTDNKLIHINYVFSDNLDNDGCERINISIDPKTREDWVTYYLYKRNIEIDRLRVKFEKQLNGFKHWTQKQEFIGSVLTEIEAKLIISNPNKVYNEERDRRYGYECEQRGEIPYRKHFNIQIDEATIYGGVCYHLKHYLLNFNPSSKIENIVELEDKIEADNDVLQSTIEDYMFDFKNEFRSIKDYEYVIGVLYSYFCTNKIGQVRSVFVKQGNKTKLAFALGEIYRAEKSDPITNEFLTFIKSLFSIFKDEDLTREPLKANNLYKYVTTKP